MTIAGPYLAGLEDLGQTANEYKGDHHHNRSEHRFH
jgi:hypothetical protein